MKKADVIEHFKSVDALAKVLGCTPQAIYMWGPDVPRSREFQIEILTNGALRAASRKEGSTSHAHK